MKTNLNLSQLISELMQRGNQITSWNGVETNIESVSDIIGSNDTGKFFINLYPSNDKCPRKAMTLRQAIGTAFSINAFVDIQVDDHDGFSHSVWKGQLHSLPKEYLDREFMPISDYTTYNMRREFVPIIVLK